jgi:CMP/dCMP kinase
VPLWTISTQEGVRGEEIARRVAERAGVRLYDRETLVAIAREHALELEAADELLLERRIGGLLRSLGVHAGLLIGSTDAILEAQLRRDLPRRARSLLGDVVRPPAVVHATVAFDVFHDHPTAVHVRIRAPREWRIKTLASDCCVAYEVAARSVHVSDRRQEVLSNLFGQPRIDDASAFSLVIDASRFTAEQVVEQILASAVPGLGETAFAAE